MYVMPYLAWLINMGITGVSSLLFASGYGRIGMVGFDYILANTYYQLLDNSILGNYGIWALTMFVLIYSMLGLNIVNERSKIVNQVSIISSTLSGISAAVILFLYLNLGKATDVAELEMIFEVRTLLIYSFFSIIMLNMLSMYIVNLIFKGTKDEKRIG